MAEIVDMSAPSSNTDRWIGMVEWVDKMNGNLVEPTASRFQDGLRKKGWKVDYYHAAREPGKKSTNYTLVLDSDVGYPEKAREDWKEVVNRHPSVQKSIIEPDGEGSLD